MTFLHPQWLALLALPVILAFWEAVAQGTRGRLTLTPTPPTSEGRRRHTAILCDDGVTVNATVSIPHVLASYDHGGTMSRTSKSSTDQSSAARSSSSLSPRRRFPFLFIFVSLVSVVVVVVIVGVTILIVCSTIVPTASYRPDNLPRAA